MCSSDLGLLRCYTSRVENNHTVPNVETLEKMARALEVPMYKLFHDGKTKAVAPKLVKRPTEWGSSEREAKILRQFQTYLGKVSDKDRRMLLAMATQLAPKAWRGRKSRSRRTNVAVR